MAKACLVFGAWCVLGSVIPGRAQAQPAVAPEPTITVTIRGAVNAPGVYDVAPREGLIGLIVHAGNFSLDPNRRPKLNRITVQHDAQHGGATETIDLNAALRHNDALLQSPLQNGDIVTVPVDWGSVFVGGAVNHTSSYEIPDEAGLSLTDAVDLAGGVGGGIALHRITIHSRVDLGTPRERLVVLKTADDGRKVMLHNGDFVFVSSQMGWGHVHISGSVRHPGFVSILDEGGISLTEAITGAGGLGARATLEDLKITNLNDGWPHKERVMSLETLEAGRGVVLHGGDFVSVGHIPPAEPIPPTVKPRQRVWQANRSEPTTPQSGSPRRAMSST